MNQFEVGDRVQGKISGKTGTITEIAGSDRYTGDIDGSTVGWISVKGDNLRLLPKPIEVVKTPRFKVGDTVKHQGSNSGTVYDVWGVHDVHVWLRERGVGGNGFGYIGIAVAYEKVLPFFVTSKAYRRQTEWSIFFQKSSAIEHFEVARVDFNQHGKPVAYGRLFLPGLESKYGWRWTTKDQHSFDMEGWEQI